MRSPGIGRGHRCDVEGNDVSAVADHHPQAVGGQAMAGDDDAGGGGDVEELGPTGWDTLTMAAASSGAPNCGCRGRTPTVDGMPCGFR